MLVRALRTAIFARSFATTSVARSDFGSFGRPGPLPLPPKDQAEFEELIRQNQVAPTADPQTEAEFEAIAEEVEHRDLRKGPKPEFEGDVNPKTGEIGGPKQDPFIAGDADWQFGGRATVSVYTEAKADADAGLLNRLFFKEHSAPCIVP